MRKLWRRSFKKYPRLLLGATLCLFVCLFFLLCWEKTSCIKSVWKLNVFHVCLGPTDPCDISLCSHPQHVCRVVDGMATCVCQQACPLIMQPVCGSDGQSYPNNCSLQVEACITGKDLTVISMGECGNYLFCYWFWAIFWSVCVRGLSRAILGKCYTYHSNRLINLPPPKSYSQWGM